MKGLNWINLKFKVLSWTKIKLKSAMREHAPSPSPLSRHIGSCHTRMGWSRVCYISKDSESSTDVIISPNLRVLLGSYHFFSGEKKKLKELKKEKIRHCYW